MYVRAAPPTVTEPFVFPGRSAPLLGQLVPPPWPASGVVELPPLPPVAAPPAEPPASLPAEPPVATLPAIPPVPLLKPPVPTPLLPPLAPAPPAPLALVPPVAPAPWPAWPSGELGLEQPSASTAPSTRTAPRDFEDAALISALIALIALIAIEEPINPGSGAGSPDAPKALTSSAAVVARAPEP